VPVIPAVPTARPTAEFQRHHVLEAPQIDGRAFHPGWRVCTRLDALLERGLIEREAYEAAGEWRRWAEAVRPLGTQRYEVRADISVTAARADAGAVHRLRAATRLRQAAEALGLLRTRILEQLLLNDCSWALLARLLRVSDKTATDRAAEAVNALADWRAGRTVPPAPEVRFRNQPGSW
jgi:hypothetical protein